METGRVNAKRRLRTQGITELRNIYCNLPEPALV